MSLRVSNNNGYTIGYDDGVNYADGRVNTSSINYQSGYNSGISYADSRVNESSISYSTGYNSGYSNGKNILSTLTSGEKTFIGLLFTPISIMYQSSIIIGGTKRNQWTQNGYEWVYDMSLDLSKIASVNFSSNQDTSGLRMYWIVGNNKIGYLPNNGSTGVTSGAKGILMETGSIDVVKVQITSFTTTDGKVHTADNLNY
jgi:hypothetical protein